MQKVFRVLFFSFLFSSFSPLFAQAAPEEYIIDPAHSSINFVIPHLMISKVSGNFGQFTGNISYDSKTLTGSKVNVLIKSTNINTDNADRDKHLRSPEFFDTEKFPEISFVSKSIQKKKNLNLCVGTLTMHGISREVSIPFSVLGQVKDPWGKERIVAEGSTLINRQDFGINWNKAIDGGVLVGNEVKVNMSIEAIKK